MAYVLRESLVVGRGKLVWDPTMIAAHYLRSGKGLAFDLFVILPFPQYFGNSLKPTSQRLEVIFSIITVLSGLMLFTLLIGNIQVFLHVVMTRKRKIQLSGRDMEWWMRRRHLPSRLRQIVRQYERQRWAAKRREDEMDIIQDLPEGLNRDIKRNLCLELVQKDYHLSKLFKWIIC